jgi:hypothetical protein
LSDRRFSGPQFSEIVTLVLVENYASLASFRRMGFQLVRSFAVVGRSRRQILIRRPGRAAVLAS